MALLILIFGGILIYTSFKMSVERLVNFHGFGDQDEGEGEEGGDSQ